MYVFSKFSPKLKLTMLNFWHFHLQKKKKNVNERKEKRTGFNLSKIVTEANILGWFLGVFVW